MTNPRPEQYRVSADARLDNREELIALLRDELGTRTPSPPADSELILASYIRWGDDCPRHLLGDFAFVIWDAPRRRLFAARDPIGMRPLCYARDGRRLVVASTVADVLAKLAAPPPLNEPLLCDLLDWSFARWVDETPYRGIHRLPPSHALVAADGRLSLTRYWTFGQGPAERFRRDGDYAERFREIFLEAVRARLRSATPVGILVSGGLDSSAVACAAQHLLATGEAAARVGLYSCVFTETPGAEEREYAEAVARRCPAMRATFLPSDDCWGLREFGEDGGYPLTEPEVSVSRALTLRPARAARADGCRVLLTGTAGDQVLGGEPYHTPVMLRDVPASRLAGELPHFLRYSRRSPASLLVDAYLRPAAPAPLRRLVRRLRARGPAALPARAATVAGDLLAPPPLASRSSQASYRALTEGAFSACLSSFDLAGRHLGVEWRFPFLDRRLIDYTLGLPARLRFRGGMIKLILRQAMAGILAEPVRQRTSLVHFQELVERGLGDRERGRVKDLLASSRAVAHGLVEGAAIAAAWEAYWRDELAAFDARRLTGFLCVEAWLRRQERPACAPGPREDVGRAFDNEPALVL